MTHRVFSRNAASSRAVPINSVIQQVENNMAMPQVWGVNQSGMTAKEFLNGPEESSARWLWAKSARMAIAYARKLQKHNLHKQIVNRILEPYQMIKVLVTSTEWNNWFWLRDHGDAQPEIKILAELMLEAKNNSAPKVLGIGDWHVPYYKDGFWTKNDTEHTLQEALLISSSCCAQTSYRKSDDTLEKAQFVWDRLIASEPVHGSPFEHQATPMESWFYNGVFSEGVTHVNKEGVYGSGNFYQWIQHRQLIPNNARYG